MVLFVQTHHLSVAPLAVAPQVDRAVHRHEVALEDVGLVVDLPIGIVTEALAADGQHHSERQIGAKLQHQADPIPTKGRESPVIREEHHDRDDEQDRQRPASPLGVRMEGPQDQGRDAEPEDEGDREHPLGYRTGAVRGWTTQVGERE